MPEEFPVTMERPNFNNRRHPDASWSDEEIAAWLRNTHANLGAVPWRLQWIEDAQAVLSARVVTTAGA